MKTVFQIILGIAIVVLGYLVVESIMKPIRFNKELEKREDATIEKLKDIRTMQIAYKDKYGKHTGNFDTLINFVKTDSFIIENKNRLPEFDPDEYTEAEGIERGLIEVTTTSVPVKDSLFGTDYPLEDIRYVPYTDGAKFKMGAGDLKTGSGVTVQVFEAYVHYDTLLADLDKQLVVNYKDQKTKITKFPGIKVGSLDEATNNAGNWEK